MLKFSRFESGSAADDLIFGFFERHCEQQLQKQNGFNNKITGTVFYSLLCLNSRRGFNGLKYMYSVISVIVDSLPGNTKTRSWTARVRLVHSWSAWRTFRNSALLWLCKRARGSRIFFSRANIIWVPKLRL